MTGSPHVPRMWGISVPRTDRHAADHGVTSPAAGSWTSTWNVSRKPQGARQDHLGGYARCASQRRCRPWRTAARTRRRRTACAGGTRVVHVDWSRITSLSCGMWPGHTCSHAACYKVGDFGFAMVLPCTPASRARFRDGELKRPWLARLCPPELSVRSIPPCSCTVPPDLLLPLV